MSLSPRLPVTLAGASALPLLLLGVTLAGCGDSGREDSTASASGGSNSGITLTITANPAEPFPFAQFMLIGQSGGGLPDLTALEPLNLTITAE